MFLAAFCCFLGILMFFHNVLLYVSRLPFNLFDLECPGETRTLGVLFCNRFVSGSKFLHKMAKSCICCAVVIASAFLFRPEDVTRLFPHSTCLGFTPTDPFDALGWLVWLNGDRIKGDPSLDASDRAMLRCSWMTGIALEIAVLSFGS